MSRISAGSKGWRIRGRLSPGDCPSQLRPTRALRNAAVAMGGAAVHQKPSQHPSSEGSFGLLSGL